MHHDEWFLQHLKDLPANILKRREIVKLDPPNTSKNIKNELKQIPADDVFLFF